jgi:hypothetical protein
MSFRASLRGPLEAAIHVIVENRLMRRFREESTATREFEPDMADVHQLLKAVAAFGHTDNPDSIERAYRAACERISILPNLPVRTRTRQELLEDFMTALRNLQRTTPIWKGKLALGCGVAVLFDGVLTVEESELVRAVCESFGIPAPPLPIAEDVKSE